MSLCSNFLFSFSFLHSTLIVTLYFSSIDWLHWFSFSFLHQWFHPILLNYDSILLHHLDFDDNLLFHCFGLFIQNLLRLVPFSYQYIHHLLWWLSFDCEYYYDEWVYDYQICRFWFSNWLLPIFTQNRFDCHNWSWLLILDSY